MFLWDLGGSGKNAKHRERSVEVTKVNQIKSLPFDPGGCWKKTSEEKF